jgi:diacylglycerol kinase family enzyme
VKFGVPHLPAHDARQIFIAANPKAGARERAREIAALQAALEAEGFEAKVEPNLLQLAQDVDLAHRGGNLRGVIAAGGDGTIAAVVNCVHEDVPVTTYPLGTENLLARYFGIRAQPQAMCEMLRSGSHRRFDAGRAGERMFLLLCSCGFDAEVVRRLHTQRSGHIDHFTYLQPLYESVRSYDYPDLQITLADADDGDAERTLTGKWVFIVNVPRYAGGLKIVSGASGTDGLLDVCIFKRGSLLHGMAYLAGVLLGQHESWTDCQIVRTRKVTIASDGEVPYQLDGDLGGSLPLTIEVLPRRVTLLVPPTWKE